MAKIVIFTEGTVTLHPTGVGVSRAEAVRQVLHGETTVRQFDRYVPNGHAVEKLSRWNAQGAAIYYLTSRRNPHEVAMVRQVLQRFAFPDQDQLLWCHAGETYQQIVERICPDLLIEDDCESLGSDSAMIYPHLSPQIKRVVAGVVVPEFGGIDALPDVLEDVFRASCTSSAGGAVSDEHPTV